MLGYIWDAPTDAYIMVVADVLTPNKHLVISNHHADSSVISQIKSSTWIILRNMHIALQTSNKKFEIGRGVGNTLFS